MTNFQKVNNFINIPSAQILDPISIRKLMVGSFKIFIICYFGLI
jgi:hypothetical protein